jgi:hypothetical protein
MKAGLRLVLFACMIVVSCRNSHSGGVTDKCGACPVLYTAEIFPTVKVRIVDKVSGADLLLSPTSPYKPSDLKVTNAANDSVRFFVDSVDAGARTIVIPIPDPPTFVLKLASLTPDTIKVVFARDSPVCCPQTRVKSVTLNNVPQCSPCSFAQLVTIKK